MTEPERPGARARAVNSPELACGLAPDVRRTSFAQDRHDLVAGQRVQ